MESESLTNETQLNENENNKALRLSHVTQQRRIKQEGKKNRTVEKNEYCAAVLCYLPTQEVKTKQRHSKKRKMNDKIVKHGIINLTYAAP